MHAILSDEQIELYFQILKTVLSRQMVGKQEGYIEYIWLRKLVQYLGVLGLDDDPRMDAKDRSPISVFSFLDAVRSHDNIDEVERCRKGPEKEKGDSYNYADALKYAIMYGHITYSKHLLQNHLEESLSQSICCPLILLAVRLDRPELVEQLCSYSRHKKESNFYIDKPGCSAMECGRTALHIAAETGNLAITQTLLRYGANNQAKDDFGNTPLGRIFIIFRLRSPHVNFKTVLCVHELLKCETKLSSDEVSVLQRLLDNNDTWKDKLAPQWHNPCSGPFSLRQICRCTIRHAMRYPHLPDRLTELGLPLTLQRFLAFEEETLLQSESHKETV